MIKEKNIHLPIGYSNFADVIHNQLDFVDKTLFIKEIFDNIETKVSVITRPRRFGKTLNLSMMRYFLAKQVHGQSTENLFQGLKITEFGDQYMRHQGQYPVIFITLKDLKENTYPLAYANLCFLLSQIYNDHEYLLSSHKINNEEKQIFQAVHTRQASPEIINSSLHLLTKLIYKHSGVKPWLLIDEYDTPIQTAYLNDYYNPMIDLMKKIFSTSLKDNDFLNAAVITGILRVSKESLFSGMNHIKIYSIFDNNYSDCFGFTEEEVKSLLVKAGTTQIYDKIRYWYNGYQIGNSVIYNPWSLVNCLQNEGLLKPYWVNTSDNGLIKYLLSRSNQVIKQDLETIIRGESITSIIDENLIFPDIDKNSLSIWSLLLFTGYLKVTHQEAKDSKIQCELAAPNQEILFLFQDIIREWLTDPLGDEYLNFLLSLTEGRVAEFSDRLQRYLLATISQFDASGQEPEKFYHGLILGMIVCLSETHEIKSNRESGYGRYDVMLIPKDITQLALILEFKSVRDEKSDLRKSAEEALQQIRRQNYAAELFQRGFKNILIMGLAFRGKKVEVFTDKLSAKTISHTQSN